ncbi:MAG: hypothetical protein ACK4S4_08615 [Pyrinomonadaceae bacterium]
MNAVRRPVFTTSCLLIIALVVATGCSIPVIQDRSCLAARESVRQFYAFHIGGDMTPSGENLEARRRYLTDELYTSLAAAPAGALDYFTRSEDYPKAFQLGACEAKAAGRANVVVNLYWRANDQNLQREVTVEAVERDDKWLINSVSGK